jgi:hypothetical protein
MFLLLKKSEITKKLGGQIIWGGVNICWVSKAGVGGGNLGFLCVLTRERGPPLACASIILLFLSPPLLFGGYPFPPIKENEIKNQGVTFF